MVLYRAVLLDPKAPQLLRSMAGRAQLHDVWETETPLEIPEISLRDSRYSTPSEDLNLPSYDSDHSVRDPDLPACRIRRASVQKSFREWLIAMMDKFMVRGTFSPLEYMFGLRSYGLKIYNSLTANSYI